MNITAQFETEGLFVMIEFHYKSKQAQKLLLIDALDFDSLEQLDQMNHSDNPH